jgi:RND superfamily putative drug exporter
MERLAHAVIRRRRIVFALWIVLSILGAAMAGGIADRLSQQFSIPGYSAYEANKRIFAENHTGRNYPLVPVFRSASGDVTKQRGLEQRIAAAAKANPGSRVSSYFNTGASAAYVSKDRHTMFAVIYPAGQADFNGLKTLGTTRAALKHGLPPGVTANLTGQQALYDASGADQGSSLGLEIAIGGFGALIVLMFVFGTLPAVAMPLMIAAASILNTYTLITLLTTVMQVSVIVQFLVAIIGLGVAIDYSLLMIFRFREELAAGRDREAAVVETMKHAGRAVIVSGSTVAIGLLSLIVLPLPFIRSIGIAGMLIPAVSVIATITLLPAMLFVLGPRINRLRVMPKRLMSSDDAESGFWYRWSRVVLKRPLAVAAGGLAIVAVLVAFGVQLNPAEAQAKDLPGKGDAISGRQALADSGMSLSAIKPFNVLIERNTSPRAVAATVARLKTTPGVRAAAAPSGPGWRGRNFVIVEAFANVDASSKPARGIIDDLQDNVLPAVENQVDGGAQITLAGQAPEDRDFVHAVYGKLPEMFAFVIVLTFLLLARAFRSLILPLKAVLLNLVSLAAAYGIIVIIFQKGFGSEALWNVQATQSIISWIPLMIFAFLYGISMDYEVFMLTRMREAYDEGLETHQAVATGLARTGKLVTSAALILCFTFFVLSTGPGVDIKQFGVGLAAGIIFDATVIRVLLVPALMELLGKWNWWLPERAARILMLPPAAEPAR